MKTKEHVLMGDPNAEDPRHSRMDRHPVSLAVGVVSAPANVQWRSAIRATWLQHKLAADMDERVVVRFVLRSGGNESAAWQRECDGRDVLCVPSVVASETRLRGPTLCTWAWLRHAVLVLNAARIVKTDDDTWLDMKLLYRATYSMPAEERVMFGAVSWWHFLPRRFQHCGYGWTPMAAERSAAQCGVLTARAPHDDLVGPFPIVSGYLMVFSRAAARAAVQDAQLATEIEQLRQYQAIGNQTTVYEDVWPWSAIHRFVEGTLVVNLLDSPGCVSTRQQALTRFENANSVSAIGRQTGGGRTRASMAPPLVVHSHARGKDASLILEVQRAAQAARRTSSPNVAVDPALAHNSCAFSTLAARAVAPRAIACASRRKSTCWTACQLADIPTTGPARWCELPRWLRESASRAG